MNVLLVTDCISYDLSNGLLRPFRPTDLETLASLYDYIVKLDWNIILDLPILIDHVYDKSIPFRTDLKYSTHMGLQDYMNWLWIKGSEILDCTGDTPVKIDMYKPDESNLLEGFK